MSVTEKRLRIQRDQVLHLLQGGSLFKVDVVESGLGEGVLIEQRHLSARLESSQRLLALALKSLDDISTMPRQARARRMALSTATFIRELQKAKRAK